VKIISLLPVFWKIYKPSCWDTKHTIDLLCNHFEFIVIGMEMVKYFESWTECMLTSKWPGKCKFIMSCISPFCLFLEYHWHPKKSITSRYAFLCQNSNYHLVVWMKFCLVSDHRSQAVDPGWIHIQHHLVMLIACFHLFVQTLNSSGLCPDLVSGRFPACNHDNTLWKMCEFPLPHILNTTYPQFLNYKTSLTPLPPLFQMERPL
jgi:hypothetical protein